MQQFSIAIFSLFVTLFSAPKHTPEQNHLKKETSVCEEPLINESPRSVPSDQLIFRKLMFDNLELPMVLAPNITATKVFQILTDNDPAGNGPTDIIRYTVTISNSGNMDATNVMFTDMIDMNTTLIAGSLKTSPILRDDTYSTIGNVSISVPVGSGLLSNDFDLDFDPLTVTAVDATLTDGDVTFNANGSFTFNPDAGFDGVTTFEYTATDGTFSRTATVSITVTSAVWFINASAPAGGDGRINTPFNNINSFNASSLDEAGDIIFVYSGTYTNTTSTVLLGQQRFIGQGAVGASLASLAGVTFSSHPPISPATIPGVGGTNPVINQASNSLNAQSQNQVRGVTLNNTAGTAFTATSFSTLLVRNVTVANTGGIAVNFINGTLDVIMQSVSASGGSYGIRLGSTAGSFEITGNGTTNGSGGTFSNIVNRGIEMITATNVTLRNIVMINANIADAGFDTVCDEDDVSACHAAVYMSGVNTVVLNNVDINGTEEHGINGLNVSNLSIINCTATTNGNSNEENALKFRNLTGTCSITGSTFDLSAMRICHIINTANNVNLTVDNCVFDNSAASPTGADCFEMRTQGSATATVNLTNSSFHRAKSKGIQCFAEGSSTFNLNITGCSVQRMGGLMAGIEVGSIGTATMNYNILNNSAIEAAQEVAVLASTNNTSILNGRLNNNPSITHNSAAATIFANTRMLHEQNSTTRYEINNNSFSSTNAQEGVIGVARLGTTASRLDFIVTNNTINNGAGIPEGIETRMGQASSPAETNVNCTRVANNSVTTAGSRAFRARIFNASGTLNLQGSGPDVATNWTSNGNTNTGGTIVSFAQAPAVIAFGGTCNLPAHPSPFAGDVVDALAIDEVGVSPEEELFIKETETSEETSISSPDEPEVYAMMAGETVIVGAPSGFTLPAMKSVTIQFDVMINDPLPSMTCSISNQGTVSGSNFSNVLTDDPAVVGAANPTVTTLQIAPSITMCPSNVMTETDPDMCVAAVSFSAAVEGCPAPTVTYSIGATPITSPYDFPVGTTTVDVLVSNGNPPNAICSFTVEVEDNQNPSITCPAGPYTRGTNMGNCSYTVSGTELNATFSDNCPGASIVNNFNNTATLAGAEFPLGNTVVQWTVTDANSNTNTCSYTVVVSDDDPPSLTCPTNVTVNCPMEVPAAFADLAAFELAGGSATDNCGINAASFTLINTSGNSFNIIRAYQISDNAGNTNSCTHTIVVDDMLPPVITPGTVASCYPTVAALEAAAIAASPAVDNCPGNITYSASTAGTCTAIVTVTATDEAGNSAETTYSSRVDNTAPVITTGSINACYTSIALAEAAALAATNATDNCPGTLTETAATVGTCNAIITVTVSDGCGNSSFTTYTTVIDDSDPVITSSNTIASCYPTIVAAEAAAIAATVATDNCPGSITYTATTSGECQAIITVTVTDGCGRTDETTYTTRIDDTDPLMITGAIAPCYATVSDAETAALAATSALDNCTGPITYAASTVGECSAVVTVTATDGCGNSSFTTYNTRIDNTAPVTTAGSINACYPSVMAAEAAALAATTATDNCPGTLTETASTVGTCTAVITITTTDECGNSSFVTYNTIIDNTSPVITPGSISACYATVAAAEAAALAATTAVDNCLGNVSFSANTSGTCSAIVTITATDFCGNFSTTTYSTRIDNTPPDATQGTIANCYPDVASAEAAALAATTATDNCPGTLTETVSTAGTCSAVITVTTTDGCGNSANVIYNTRIDNAGPSVTKGSISACYPTVLAAEAAAIAATTASDDCPTSLSYTASTIGTCSAVVTVTVTDGCGNSAFTTYDTRIDNTAPTITSGSIAACFPSLAAAEAAAIATTSATDNCPGVVNITAATIGTCDATITVTATDGCGNSSFTTYNTRIDNIAPIITSGTIDNCYPSVLAAETAALAATSATDNCPGTISYLASTAGDCNAVITVTATDGCGNSSMTTYNTRIDNTNPVITSGSIDACYLTQAAAEAAALAATSATDNCPGMIAYTVSTTGDCSATITVTATDFCGNSSNTSYFTRIDNTAPVPVAGSINLCYNTAALAEAAAIAATSATDNCPGILDYSASSTGTCEAIVTVFVTDQCGNSSFVTYNTKIDNQGPVITPGTLAGCYPTQAAAETAALAVTSAMDDCPSSLTYNVSTIGDCSAMVTVTVTDGCMNSSSHTYNTRIDNQAPIAVCKTETVFVNISGPYELTPDDVFDAQASSDNCPGELTVISILPASVSCDELDMTVPVQVIVQDFCGYRDTCTALITVAEDNAIPTPWTNTSIGGAPGSAQAIPCLAEGTFEVSSSGFPSPTSDKQNFLHQTICGDAEIIVHVSAITGGGSAGVEFRETLLPGSKKASLKTQLTNIIRRQVRLVTNGPAQQVLLNKPNPPAWLRMTRIGNVFTGYTSVNGVNWDFAFTATIAMANCISVGMLSEGINNSVTNNAWFDSFEITGSGSAPRPFKGTIPEDQKDELLVELYPNPAHQWVMVATPELSESKILTVTAYNTLGNLMDRQQLAGGHTSLDIATWLPGIYWIKVELDGKSVTRKLVKMH